MRGVLNPRSQLYVIQTVAPGRGEGGHTWGLAPLGRRPRRLITPQGVGAHRSGPPQPGGTSPPRGHLTPQGVGTSPGDQAAVAKHPHTVDNA